MLIGNIRSRIHRWREQRKAAAINKTRLWMEPQLRMQQPAYGKEAAIAGGITAFITAGFELFGVGAAVQGQIRRWAEYVCGAGEVPPSPIRLEPTDADVHERAVKEGVRAHPLPHEKPIVPDTLGEPLEKGVRDNVPLEDIAREPQLSDRPVDNSGADAIHDDERPGVRETPAKSFGPEVVSPELLRARALEQAIALFHVQVDAGGTWSAPRGLFERFNELHNLGFSENVITWLTDAAKDFTEHGDHFRQGLLELMVPGQPGVTPTTIKRPEIFLEHLFSGPMLDEWIRRISQAPAGQLTPFPDPLRGRMMEAIRLLSSHAQVLLSQSGR
jgi:hypothetical protein